MKNPIHIMLDLETWGTEPGCDIRSIGACVFNPLTGYVADPDDLIEMNCNIPHTFYIACDNPVKEQDPTLGIEREYPLHRDPRTVKWWSEQSEAAQAAFADPVDLRVALGRFSGWLCDLIGNQFHDTPFEPIENIRLWSHGAHFDGPILAAAYKAVGLPVPWHYRAPRDTRTAFDMAGIDDHSAWLAQHPGPMGVAHHALDDAICQARAVCAAWARIDSIYWPTTKNWKNGDPVQVTYE